MSSSTGDDKSSDEEEDDDVPSFLDDEMRGRLSRWDETMPCLSSGDEGESTSDLVELRHFLDMPWDDLSFLDDYRYSNLMDVEDMDSDNDDVGR